MAFQDSSKTFFADVLMPVMAEVQTRAAKGEFHIPQVDLDHPQNKLLLGGGFAIGFYSHTNWLGNERTEDALLEINRKSLSNLQPIELYITGCADEFSEESITVQNCLGVKRKSSEAHYQACKFQNKDDSDFVALLEATDATTKEIAFSGRRGHLPLTSNEIDYFTQKGLELAWVDLEAECDDRVATRQRSALKSMAEKTRRNMVARDEQGRVCVRIAPVRDDYFGTDLGQRVMYSALVEKFLGPNADKLSQQTLVNLAANPNVEALIEVRQPDGPEDEIWTDNFGTGKNMLGKMLFHLVLALRCPSVEEALNHLHFGNMRNLHTRADELFVYS